MLASQRVTTRALLPLTLAANAAGALVVFVFFTFVLPAHAAHQATVDVHHRLSTLLFVAFLLAFLPVSVAQFRGAEAPVIHWLQHGGPPDDRVTRAVLRQPIRQAAWSFADWCVGAAVFGILNMAIFGGGWELSLRVSAGILLGGLGTCAMAYLLVERQLRPLFAVVLKNAEDKPWALRIRTRLLVFWALSSGVPLLAIALGPIGLDERFREQLVGPATFIAAAGIVAGSATLFIAARAVTDPLDELRTALEHVQRGDFSVSVAVDDVGEVGLLEDGFNHMVEGLRERKQLADLFGRHVGEEVAREAMRRGTQLGGELREVSALFVDLIGSTALAERLPAEEVVAQLNAMFEAVVTCVTREGGWVNKFEGDGALCVWGAPADQPDHAARALRAARSLGVALAAHPTLDAAIGVSSGTAVAGNIGSTQRFEYTVIGRPVNEASRLTEVAKHDPRRVLSSGESVRRAGDEAKTWTAAGEVVLRGRDTPTAIYRPE